MSYSRIKWKNLRIIKYTENWGLLGYIILGYKTHLHILMFKKSQNTR